MTSTTARVTAHHHVRGIALVMGAGFCFSLSGLILRHMEAADGWQVIFYRSFAFVAVILAILALRHRGRVGQAFLDIGWLGLVGGICLGTSGLCVVWSFLHTTIANTTFIFGALPFLTALLAWAVLGEKVRAASWIAMAVVLVGIGVMMAGGFGGDRLMGNVLAIIGTLALAILTIALRKGRQGDMMPVLVVGALFAGLACAVIAPDLSINRHDFVLTMVMGVVSIAGGFILFTLGARYVRAGEMWILSNVELIFAPLWVWLAVAELPLVETFIGGAIIVLAICGQAVITARHPADA